MVAVSINEKISTISCFKNIYIHKLIYTLFEFFMNRWNQRTHHWPAWKFFYTQGPNTHDANLCSQALRRENELRRACACYIEINLQRSETTSTFRPFNCAIFVYALFARIRVRNRIIKKQRIVVKRQNQNYIRLRQGDALHPIIKCKGKPYKNGENDS